MKKIVFIFIILSISACSDFLHEYSQHLVIPKTPTELNEILIGGKDGYLPSQEVDKNSSQIMGSWFNVLDDDINGVKHNNAPANWNIMRRFYFGYTTWQLEVGRNLEGNINSKDDQLWKDFYHRINAMNMILIQLEEVSKNTKKEKLLAKRIEGECLFLRAQFYFILTNIYGKAYSPNSANNDLAVPLKLTHYIEYDKEKEVQFQRATVSQMYVQIIDDLTKSIAAFEESSQPKTLYRASKSAALLLLSRVYLYQQNWDKALSTAKVFLKEKNELLDYATIATQGYAITRESPEFIFSQGAFALQNAMTAQGGDFCVSDELANQYNSDDLRLKIYFSYNTLTSKYALSRKYKMGIARSYVSDAFTLRTAEAYLNAAEAAAVIGKKTEATTLLNDLMKNRYSTMPDVTILNDDELVKFVREERRRELCYEGHRWFDLRRYAADVKYPMKKEITRIFPIYDDNNRSLYVNTRIYTLAIDDDAYVFAIPRSLMDKEPKQIQNPREKRLFELEKEANENENENKEK